jgi:diguanylate cyclase (GGDEF)-like protein
MTPEESISKDIQTGQTNDSEQVDLESENQWEKIRREELFELLRKSTLDETVEMMLKLEREKRLSIKLATNDELTELLNKRGLNEEWERIIAHKKRNPLEKLGTLIGMDLNGFKFVNDNFGHQVGDEVLLIMARILQKRTRKNDVKGRPSGDEFELYMDGATIDISVEKMLEIDDDFREQTRKLFQEKIVSLDPEKFGQQKIRLTDLMGDGSFVSISWGIIPVDLNKTIDSLRAEADGLMFAQKREKKANGIGGQPRSES